jgi:hypothetical protein
VNVRFLSRLKQNIFKLNIRTPPYETNVSACFIVHSTLHVSALISGHPQVNTHLYLSRTEVF